MQRLDDVHHLSRKIASGVEDAMSDLLVDHGSYGDEIQSRLLADLLALTSARGHPPEHIRQVSGAEVFARADSPRSGGRDRMNPPTKLPWRAGVFSMSKHCSKTSLSSRTRALPLTEPHAGDKVGWHKLTSLIQLKAYC
jgi:hypothetical protein